MRQSNKNRSGNIYSGELENLSANQFLKDFQSIPYEKLRSNHFRNHREIWCTAKMLKNISLGDFLISANNTQADSVDNIIISGDLQMKFKVQVTEIAPRSRRSIHILGPFKESGYTDLKDQTFEIITSAVSEKEKLYTAEDKRDLNLLIYFNPPYFEDENLNPSTWTILLETNLDLDFDKIKSDLSKSKFGSIIFLLDDKSVFIKNSKLTPSM